MGESTAPVGRAAVSEALVRSAARLFAQRGLDDVSVREIAAAAGVNHALVFRHFGSKAGLLRAVLVDLAQRMSTAVDRADARVAIDADFRLYVVILARALLDSDDPVVEPDDEHPVADWLRARALAEGVDPARGGDFAATVMALELGWRFFAPFLSVSAGIDVDRVGDLRDESSAAVIAALVERWRG